MSNNSLKSLKKYYTTCAEELGYGDEVVKKISEAKSETRIINILATARHEAMRKEERKHGVR